MAKSKHLKWGLLLVITLTVGALVWAFMDHRRTTDRPWSSVENVDADADMRLGKVRQTATRDGVKEWDLVAASAKYQDAENRVIFQDIVVTFFLKEQQEVTVKAREGILQTDSKDMALGGSVVVSNQGYRLETESLTYRNNDRKVVSEVPVAISGDAFHFTADSLFIDIEAEEARLEGKVNGSFHEDIML